MVKKIYGLNLGRKFDKHQYDMIIIASNKQEAFEIAQSEFTIRRLNPAQIRELYLDRSCIIHRGK